VFKVIRQGLSLVGCWEFGVLRQGLSLV
jgi:hypothetical protein